MQRKLMSAGALLALGVLVAVAAVAAPQKITKQVGGVSGDSSIVAADTSVALQLPSTYSSLRVIAASDSSLAYTVQMSPDGVKWFTVDIDTVAAGTAEATADFGTTYPGFYLRVITDNLTAGGAAFGTAWTVIDQ